MVSPYDARIPIRREQMTADVESQPLGPPMRIRREGYDPRRQPALTLHDPAIVYHLPESRHAEYHPGYVSLTVDEVGKREELDKSNDYRFRPS